MIQRRTLLISSAAFSWPAIAPAQSLSSASTFPSRPLVWVVPYPAGAFADAVSRVIAQQISASLKQPVIVENKPGAAGQIAAAYVKQQPADGHTLFYGNLGPFAMNAALYPKLSYSMQKDFMPLTRLLTSPLLLVVSAGSPIQSLDDLLKLAKTENGVAYGSFGPGSQPHIWMEMLKRETGGNFQHVAYKGAAPALTDLMGGHFDVLLDVAANSMHFVQDGKLRALALVGSDHRLVSLPQVPTIAELGHASLNAPGWTGVVLRAGTPPDVVGRLHSAVVQAVQSDELKQRFGYLAGAPAPMSPADFGRFIQSETDRWGAAIKNAGVVLE